MRNIVSRGANSGFSLIEVLIVLVILGAIAAFVVPNVVNRASDAEPTRVAGDLRNIGEALSVFQLDTRGAVPGDLEDLVNAVTPDDDAVDATVAGAAYSAAQANRWDGPYLKNTIATAAASTDSVIVTGFGGSVVNRVNIYQTAGSGAIEAPGASVTCDAGEYAALRLDGLTADQLGEVNAIFDGEGEANAATAGTFRWIGTSGYYLAAACR